MNANAKATNTMTAASSQQHPNRHAREWAIKFLYKCEIERIYHFSPLHLQRFIKDFDPPAASVPYLKRLVEGVLDNLNRLNQLIESRSANWSIDRMATIDRCVLRLATFEISEKLAPRKVAINEAIELAKLYGSKDSASFVNGLLDKVEA